MRLSLIETARVIRVKYCKRCVDLFASGLSESRVYKCCPLLLPAKGAIYSTFALSKLLSATSLEGPSLDIMKHGCILRLLPASKKCVTVSCKSFKQATLWASSSSGLSFINLLDLLDSKMVQLKTSILASMLLRFTSTWPT